MSSVVLPDADRRSSRPFGLTNLEVISVSPPPPGRHLKLSTGEDSCSPSPPSLLAAPGCSLEGLTLVRSPTPHILSEGTTRRQKGNTATASAREHTYLCCENPRVWPASASRLPHQAIDRAICAVAIGSPSTFQREEKRPSRYRAEDPGSLVVAREEGRAKEGPQGQRGNKREIFRTGAGESSSVRFRRNKSKRSERSEEGFQTYPSSVCRNQSQIISVEQPVVSRGTVASYPLRLGKGKTAPPLLWLAGGCFFPDGTPPPCHAARSLLGDSNSLESCRGAAAQ
ncbi:hypothetical protein CSUB01_02124 [Colletotrichum sublineola]|uniref:Uncharacterized protein n=1 Tax=Colletotrichum sublineola TaxID=1173701 RepID=A0A066XBT6_COLSU|nr:hypothetical protein CSUB01_02124 [Colletotrichum sublineola]